MFQHGSVTLVDDPGILDGMIDRSAATASIASFVLVEVDAILLEINFKEQYLNHSSHPSSVPKAVRL